MTCMWFDVFILFFFSSRRRHTRCALVTGVQTCALPISLAGLNHDEDIFAPVRGAAKRRAVWLGINLLTAFLASSVVDLFQGSISKVEIGRASCRERVCQYV